MEHRLDYENYEHLCRLRRALRAGKHAALKPLFPDIVRMNLRRFHEPGLTWAEEDRYESYDDFLNRCWYIHHLVGDLWDRRPAIVGDEWAIQP